MVFAFTKLSYLYYSSFWFLFILLTFFEYLHCAMLRGMGMKKSEWAQILL